MSSRVTDPRPPAALREQDLLARLGLRPGASDGEVEAAHDEILDFLDRAPESLGDWARLQVAHADEAYAHLNGAPLPVAPIDIPPDEEIDDDPDETQGPVVVIRRDRRSRSQAQAQAQAHAKVPRREGGGDAGALVIERGTVRTLGIGAGAVVLVAALVIGVYGFAPGGLPGLTGTPKPEATAGVSTQQVADLMQKIAANPKDTVSLMALGNLYYGTSDYATAETWFEKVLGVEPSNVDALLALGAAQYNSGDEASAQAAWAKVLGIDPKNLEAHYDLGFMYFSQNPPNVEKAQAEWGEVITLAPDSEIAQTVKAHLSSLGSPAPGSATPSASPPPAGSPAPSPAAS
jgi:cytochrome c-type biogenesis protein CcmH/NrfG